jgi:HAD superfamily hydrolase (TIGR01490 family)
LSLALFDLDNTLLNGDSDYLWGLYLSEHGIVDGERYMARNQAYYDQYKAGTLDIQEFLRFQLQPLADHAPEQLLQWREQYLQEHIQPILQARALALLDEHRAHGHELVIITATNRFITGPIAELLGVEHLLATEPEMRDGRYTGAVAGTPCFQEGKVSRLRTWLAQRGLDLGESWFYSDSHNDLPLLQQVTHPVAVDPDDALRAHAHRLGWPIISLRD